MCEITWQKSIEMQVNSVISHDKSSANGQEVLGEEKGAQDCEIRGARLRDSECEMTRFCPQDYEEEHLEAEREGWEMEGEKVVFFVISHDEFPKAGMV